MNVAHAAAERNTKIVVSDVRNVQHYGDHLRCCARRSRARGSGTRIFRCDRRGLREIRKASIPLGKRPRVLAGPGAFLTQG